MPFHRHDGATAREGDGTAGPRDSTESPGPVAGDRPMSLEEIEASYDEYAGWIHRFERVERLVTGRYRRERFGDVTGRVLDVACGTGTNAEYLPETAEYVGVDISSGMLSKARDRLDRLDIDGTLHRMDAQDLGFDDGEFDAVISALSTCTFPAPAAALREMERVCDPEGTIRLVEHGRSDVGPVARFQEWRADAHYETAGCRWTQEPRAVVADAGLSVRDATTGALGTITSFEIDPG
jgi:ubiquinone/menaquinone biosynthesis C-methylase UbiE